VTLLHDVASKLGKWFFGVSVAVIIMSVSSTYIYGFLQSLYLHTDYRNYSRFIFPTRGMIAAYDWLDKQTPTESTVIAGYEAASNILLYSHNYVVGNKQGWPEPAGTAMEKARDAFYTGVWNPQEASDYLRKNNVQYVYQGYQEPDGFTGKYPFLKPVFRNSDATIYEVQY
jgi:hypothetical protein